MGGSASRAERVEALSRDARILDEFRHWIWTLVPWQAGGGGFKGSALPADSKLTERGVKGCRTRQKNQAELENNNAEPLTGEPSGPMLLQAHLRRERSGWDAVENRYCRMVRRCRHCKEMKCERHFPDNEFTKAYRLRPICLKCEEKDKNEPLWCMKQFSFTRPEFEEQGG